MLPVFRYPTFVMYMSIKSYISFMVRLKINIIACSVFDDGSCLYYNRANLYNTGTGTVMVGGDRDAFYLANG